MGTTADKTTYLNGTKLLLKDAINGLGGDIDNETTFREYVQELWNVYNNLPKVSDTGTEVTLTPTLKGKLGIVEKGNSTQETTNGYQLLTLADGTYTNDYGITSKVTNGEIVVNGTATANSTNYIPFQYTFLANTNYTISANNPVAASGSTVILRFDGDVAVFSLNSVNRTYTFSFTENKTVSHFVVRIQNGETMTNFKLKPQLELGTTAHTWEKYTGGQASPNPSFPSPIKSVTGNNNVVLKGKNEFNKNTSYAYTNGQASDWTITELDTGVRIKTSVTNAGRFVLYAVKDLTDYVGKTVRCKMNYTVSGNRSGLYVLGLCDQNGGSRATKTATSNVSSGTEISFTVPALTGTQTYLALWLYSNVSSGATADDYIDYTDLIITIDNADMTYMPYVTPQTLPLNLGTIELNKIGNYQDYIYKNNDNWYKKEYIKKLVLNGGSESEDELTYGGTSGNTCYFTLKLRAKTTDTTQCILCDKLGFSTNATSVANANNYMTNLTIGVNNNGTSLNAFIKNTDYTSIGNFQTWLATITPTISYQLETPTDIQITDSTLISQLEDIDKLLGYNGTTIITSTYDSNNAQMIIQASAIKGE